MPDADGPVALVTGAARGIGAASVAALAAAGYRVVGLDACLGEDHRLPGVDYPLAARADLDAVLAPLGERGIACVADVRDRTALERAVSDAVARFGRLDVVVAAAAVLSGGAPLWETPPEHLATLWDIDVAGVVNTAAATVPQLLRAPDPAAARFVAVASAAATRGLFHLGGYAIAKHAVLGVVRALAQDLAGTPVVTVAVAPGSTRTAMLDATAAVYDVEAGQLARSQLLPEVLEPADIAAVIAFCCTPAGRTLHGSLVEAGAGFTG